MRKTVASVFEHVLRALRNRFLDFLLAVGLVLFCLWTGMTLEREPWLWFHSDVAFFGYLGLLSVPVAGCAALFALSRGRAVVGHSALGSSAAGILILFTFDVYGGLRDSLPYDIHWQLPSLAAIGACVGLAINALYRWSSWSTDPPPEAEGPGSG